MSNDAAAQALTAALKAGKTLTIKCNNGDTVTVGQQSSATAEHTHFHALRWGRSKWADASGLEFARDSMANFVAWDVVRACGRGAVSRGLAAWA